ncbi:unnamed protein product [Prunus armeniaca]|uniref:Uncharacterized protein n=1 Tax=Prunus armeniaca TaxID=36596 RepID=A0A6J5US05_PRUAR|nr:unnamed protein product [Prunus armeniaca]
MQMSNTRQPTMKNGKYDGYSIINITARMLNMRWPIMKKDYSTQLKGADVEHETAHDEER